MTSKHLGIAHRCLIGVVATGVVAIAGVGFAGSYTAVRQLAERQGFGDFAAVYPIGIDAGICVLLALDLLLTWLRIPFPLLRQAAWLLTAATIAFNGAAAWPDPLGTAMHAVIPVLFVISVEAARHAIGRIADITADKHMEGVRLTRWLLSPIPTFLLWRRMKLWELRSYDKVIELEQQRLVYVARLRSRFGRGWRRKAPVALLVPLRLAKYGIPVGPPPAAVEAAAERSTMVICGGPGGVLQLAAIAPRSAATAPTVTRRGGAVKPPRPAPPKTPRKAPAKRAEGAGRSAAKAAIRALYDTHGRRPLEGEMTAELKRIKSKFTSRQFANDLRREIEKKEPKLAARGAKNVRALTGTDG